MEKVRYLLLPWPSTYFQLDQGQKPGKPVPNIELLRLPFEF